jgi:hypothetical protein
LHAIPNGHTCSSAPDDQYVSSLASQWMHMIGYLKDVYPQAARTGAIGFSPLCNIGLTIASLNYGLMTTLGLGIDGQPAQGPRPGAVGLALDESIPPGDLRTVYRGIAPSQLPGILALGEWGVCNTGTAARLRKFREDHPTVTFAAHAPARALPRMKLRGSCPVGTRFGRPTGVLHDGTLRKRASHPATESMPRATRRAISATAP